MQNLFQDTATIRVALIREFYSRPEVLEDICNIIKSQTNCFSNAVHNPSNSSIQIQVKKSYLKKSEVTVQDSASFYGLLNMTLHILFDKYRACMIDILGRLFIDRDPNCVFESLKAYVSMLYNITIASNNAIILYL